MTSKARDYFDAVSTCKTAQDLFKQAITNIQYGTTEDIILDGAYMLNDLLLEGYTFKMESGENRWQKFGMICDE